MSSERACSVDSVDLTESIEQDVLDDLASLCCFAMEAESARSYWEVTLVFTTDEHIAQLHEEFMQIAGPTDIMTFPSEDDPGGDIIISVAQADRQRHDDGWDLPSELGFLVVHGALHLVGWTDGSAEQRNTMLDRQRQIVRAYAQIDSSSR